MRTSGVKNRENVRNRKGAERRDECRGQVFKKQHGAYESYLEGGVLEETTERKQQ